MNATDRSALDICAAAAVDRFIADTRPDIVVNTAAYTAVDLAEQNPELACQVNRDGPANLARACDRVGAALIHLSTDYVFAGTTDKPCTESVRPAPQTAYGASKLAGEQAVAQLLERHVILRLSWVFSEYGNNFLKTMLRLAGERSRLTVVDDQHGCPTYAGHAAAAIARIAGRLQKNPHWGTFHYCDGPATTWFGFAREIVAAARQSHNIKTTEITPVTTAEFPTPAPRPRYSVLDCSKIDVAYGIQPQPWVEGIATSLRALSAAG